MVLRKLKDKFSKRLSVSHGPIVDSGAREVSKSPAEIIERHGLSFVAEGPSAHDGAEQYPVDIIAIHGLNGDAFQTWTHPNGTMWIRHLLPGILPGCRVYTYGYPAKVFFNPSISGVREYSRGLLSAVRDLHEDVSARTCFVFVAG